jgi:hypothetical protein
MMLRKLARSIQEQNWFTAVLEITIVVIGIFLGLQVDSLNEERKDRELEQQYLERLHADAIAAVERQTNALNVNEEILRQQAVVIEALRASHLPPDLYDEFSAGLAQAGIHNPLIWQWGTVEELYSTGNIRLIRDLGLRDLISATETHYQHDFDFIKASTQKIHISWGQISTRFDPVEYDLSLRASAKVRFDFEALAADDEFVAAFSNLHLNSKMITLFSESHLGSLRRFEAGIAKARDLDQ